MRHEAIGRSRVAPTTICKNSSHPLRARVALVYLRPQPKLCAGATMRTHAMGHGYQVWLAALTVLTTGATAGAETLTGAAAFGDWRTDRPGVTRHITANDLPKPWATPSAGNGSRIVQRPAGAKPQVPDGFDVALFAEGLTNPRIIRIAPNGDIFVAETAANRIRVLRSADGESTPSVNETYAGDLNRPFG